MGYRLVYAKVIRKRERQVQLGGRKHCIPLYMGNVRQYTDTPGTLRVGILRQLRIMFAGLRTAHKRMIKSGLVMVAPVNTQNYKAKLAKSNGILVDNVST
jgi:hypothetical protein